MLAFKEIFDRLINKYARNKNAKISESQSHGVFLVRCRRTYVLKKGNNKKLNIHTNISNHRVFV